MGLLSKHAAWSWGGRGGYRPRAVPSPPRVLLLTAAATIALLSVRSWHRQSAVA